MAKTKSVFYCTECGNETAKWADETMLDKARKMLYAMLDTHQDSYGYDFITAPAYDSVEEFVNDFCKAMEA